MLALLATWLSACGGGSDASPPEPPEPPEPSGPFQVLYEGPVASGVAVTADGTVVFSPTAPGGYAALGPDGRLRRYGSGGGTPAVAAGSVVLVHSIGCRVDDDCVDAVVGTAPDGTRTTWFRSYDQPVRPGIAVDRQGAAYIVGANTFDGAEGFVARLDGPAPYAWLREVAFGEPLGPLSPAADGWIYGVARPAILSGTAANPESAFRVSRDGVVEVLASFVPGGAVRGLQPGLAVGDDGWITGHAAETGAHGVLYRMRTDGTDLAVAHTFAWGGVSPALLLGADGHVYGTTREGGDGRGVVFRLRGDDQRFEVVHRFSPAGDPPAGPLGQLPDGQIVGTTNRTDAAGSPRSGSVYRLQLPG